jgi:hypothetical protein
MIYILMFALRSHHSSASVNSKPFLYLLRAYLILECAPLQRQLFRVNEVRMNSKRHSVGHCHARYGFR